MLEASNTPDEMTGQTIEFIYQTPGDETTLPTNVAHALSLGLPEADADTRRISLIANGPSARYAPLGGPTLAINGALSLFTSVGLAPTFWAACDPQALVADFLADAPESTTYLVASKCDALIFEMLQDRDVRLWHIADCDEFIGGRRSVPTATSATMCALQLLLRLGYRRVDVYGWDCCYVGDEHHAGVGITTPEQPLTLVIDSTKAEFRTRRTWAAEAQDASRLLPYLKWAGCEVSIHGGGMVAAINPDFAHR